MRVCQVITHRRRSTLPQHSFHVTPWPLLLRVSSEGVFVGGVLEWYVRNDKVATEPITYHNIRLILDSLPVESRPCRMRGGRMIKTERESHVTAQLLYLTTSQ